MISTPASGTLSVNQNIAYEGMIFRELAESKNEAFYAELDWDMVHFIGFNALNECEKNSYA